MRNLIQFIYRFRAFLVFLILEGVSIYLLVQNNSYQNAAFYNSANTYVGKVLELRSNITNYFRLVQVNQMLVQENARLREQALANQKLAADTLFGQTDSVLVVPDSANKPVPYHFIGAKVINNSVRRLNNYFTLNIGKEDGVAAGMGVVSPLGVAGRVKAVSENYATVTWLLHSQTLVSAKLPRDGTFGTIKWDEGDDARTASLHYIPLHVKVFKGDTVTTSGYNSLFPEGILIGRVISVKKEADKSFFTIKVRLAVDYTKLGIVYVIKNLRQAERDSLEAKIRGKKLSKLGITHFIQFFIFVILQIFLVQYLVLFNTAFCFIYLAFLLFLPIQLPPVILLLMGFTTGITIDTFYDTAGIHAGACVLLTYVRPHVLRFLTPRDDYDANDSVNVRLMGWGWFVTYALVLIFLHHLVMFFLEVGGIKAVGFTLLKVVASTIYTFTVVVILQLLFFSARRAVR